MRRYQELRAQLEYQCTLNAMELKQLSAELYNERQLWSKMDFETSIEAANGFGLHHVMVRSCCSCIANMLDICCAHDSPNTEGAFGRTTPEIHKTDWVSASCKMCSVTELSASLSAHRLQFI